MDKEKSESLYPMYFGASCAFFALNLLSDPDARDDNKWSIVSEKMLQGSAHLLGTLVWKIQTEGTNRKTRDLEAEVDELKKRRREDAKANEKVVSIFAAQEQSWFVERRKLRQNIGALINELRVLDKKKGEAIREMEKRLTEEENKKSDLETKLKKAEEVAEEMRETAKRVAQDHATEIRKHKTSFIELVSNHRQLEAEMGRALRQVEETKQELSSVSEQKEESMLMLIKMHKDAEQKEKILSAMMRKSKLDSAEKQMLLKELKSSKTQTERLRAALDSTREKHSFRSMLTRHSHPSSSQVGRTKSQPTHVVHVYDDPEFRKEAQVSSPLSGEYSPEAGDEFDDVKRLQGWVHSEAEKYATVVEQRHQLEIDAFADQMRLKDEKLEAFHWKLLSTELETKRLKSHIEGLTHDMSQLRHDNIRLESSLMEREEELNSLKNQVVSHLKLLNRSKNNLNPSLNDCKEVALVVQSPEEGFEEEEGEVPTTPLEIVAVEECHVSPGQLSAKADKSPWRMDLNALGVSYKIKRLKQQLLLLERLAGKRETGEDVGNGDGGDEGRFGMKGFVALMSLLNKQVVRYQSLQGKTDDLCKRLHGNEPDLYRGESTITSRTKVETRTLEHYLEETFQLQRYIVATGQKMSEIQAKIGSGFVGVTEELDKSATFDRKRFGDGMRSLFQEVQRGLEVRIARVIGDLEGTLACEGMIHLRR